MGYTAKNNAFSTLAAGITDVATSLTVQAGKGALFDVTTPVYTYATLEDVSGNIEVVKVTARSTDTLTIVRAQDGTAARAWNSGDVIECRPCSAAMNDYAVGPQIDGSSAKTTPVDADKMGILDSAASNVLKYVTWANIKATLASTFAALGGLYTQAFAAASIELGHASDTTLTRTAAGQIAVEGNALYSAAMGAMGLRNKIINGGMQISQRGTNSSIPAANTPTYGGADRIYAAHTAGTAWSLLNSGGQPAASSKSGYGQQVQLTTSGAGTATFGTRIEGANTYDLNSKSVTVSGWLYQDTGGSLDATVNVRKPTTTLDTFSASTSLGTSGNISVATATYVPFTYTLALGSTDASLGLEVIVTFTIGSAVTTKAFMIGDFQLEAGSVATPFETRPVGMELALCQRYYEQSSYNILIRGDSANISAYRPIFFQTTKRASPTVTLASLSYGGTGSGGSAVNPGVDGFESVYSVGATVSGSYAIFAYAAASEL
jgi:hypothetical protein